MTTALDSCLTAAWFIWTNQNALIRTVTNEFASTCIENRLRQMAIFKSLSKWGKDPLDSFSIKTNEILYDLSLYNIKETHSMLPCVCSVIDHRRRQNVVITSVTHSAITSCATFFVLITFWCHLWPISDACQHGIYLCNKSQFRKCPIFQHFLLNYFKLWLCGWNMRSPACTWTIAANLTVQAKEHTSVF